MPTPFYHLSLVRDLLVAGQLPPLLGDEWPAFCLGNIAPDAQNISGQTRAATHFFDVPMTDLTPAWHVMFHRFPRLADPAPLSPAHAAFVAGYLCHLALDQVWIADIFDPVFGEHAGWDSFRRRLFLHNVLRVYLDRLDLPKLQNGTGGALREARPRDWLPFLADDALSRWRDFVADQLADGGESQTIEVFAARMRVAPAEFESLLQSPAAMQENIFRRLPFSSLNTFRQRGLDRTLEVIAEYLGPARR
ncbi:MAG: zinc dependent phospholipase C family protein [Chloroflexi bacterium]|nr:zinc dependent phospholipase C family protein [Chloroflexota bacterium]